MGWEDINIQDKLIWTSQHSAVGIRAAGRAIAKGPFDGEQPQMGIPPNPSKA